MNDVKNTIAKLQSEIDERQTIIDQLKSIFGGKLETENGNHKRPAKAQPTLAPYKRRMSAKGIASIKRAQRARWKKIKAEKAAKAKT